MRLVYMDEAGISRNEPIAVVAGIIIHGDAQLNGIERRLMELVERHIPEDARNGFVFHATHILNGVTGEKRVLGRQNPEWPTERRLAIADDLASLCVDFDVPITVGVVQRSQMGELFRGFPSLPEAEAALNLHAAAFLTCSMYVEAWMRQFAGQENCLLVVENNERHRSHLRKMQRDLQNMKEGPRLEEHLGQFLPFKTIREDPLFQEKKPYSPIQIADFVAYFIKKRLNGDKRAPRFTDRFWPLVVSAQNEDAPLR